MGLEEYTTRQLEEEIELRADKKKRDDILDRSDLLWCDECIHWRSAKSSSPRNYNCCSKKQKMHFIEPSNPWSEDWGFYRRRRRHREELPKPKDPDWSDPYWKDRKETPPPRSVPVGVKMK